MSEDIILEQERGTAHPVLRRRNIGERFIGGLLKQEWRDLRKDGEPVIKDNGKPAKQLVVTLLTKEATMAAGIGGTDAVPEPGDVVRLILDGGGAGQWIEARNTYGGPLKVGLLVAFNMTHAIRYEAKKGGRELGRIDNQTDLDTWAQSPANIDRRESLGRRGDLAMKDCDDPQFVEACKAKYRELETTPDIHLEPFSAPVTAGTGNSGGGGDPADLW